MSEPSLRHTETGYLTTDLWRSSPVEGDSTFVLHRVPGARQQDPLIVPEEVITQLGRLPVEGVRWSVGRPLGSGPSGLAFDVPGEASAATLTLAGMPNRSMARILGPLGSALASVHDSPAWSGPEPAGLRRLERWLKQGTGPGEAGRLYREAQETPGLFDALTDAIAILRTAPRVTLLGAAGGNNVFPAPSGDHVAVLVTDEVSFGPAAWDLGWILGEWLELTNDPHAQPTKQSLSNQPVLEAIRTGYNRPIDLDQVAAACVLRWAVHLHDFAAFVEWADDFAARLSRLNEHAHDLAGVLGAA